MATEAAGGIGAGTIKLSYSDVVGNSAPATPGGSNLAIETPVTLETFASVIANPLGGGANCEYDATPAATSSGYNFISDTSCLPGGGAAPVSTDLIVPNGNPQLGSLAANGGPTPTLLPAPGSPLLDAIPVSACQTAPLGTGVTTDQRGVRRPQGAGCDVGAVELEVATPLVVVPEFTG